MSNTAKTAADDNSEVLDAVESLRRSMEARQERERQSREAEEQGLVPYDKRLSSFGLLMVSVDRDAGRKPRFHEGMSLQDAVIVTGLPENDARRRLAEMKRDPDPDNYAALHLCEGAGEKYPADPTTAPPQPAKILQFPLPFGGDTRASSNLMARCALFAPVKERQYFKDYTIVGEVDGCLIEWKGEQLNQDDHDTLLQLVIMARHKPFGVDVVQPVNAILRGLERHTQKEQRRQLFEQADRIMSGTVRITPRGKPSYAGHLIVDMITPQNQQTEPQYRRHLSYQLNPKFGALYEDAAYTLINWQERLKLKGRGSEFAKWLQLLIESHADFKPRKVRTLWEESGKATKNIKHFREKLRQALDLLKEAGIITAWSIDPRPESEPYGDLVAIERTPSPSQQKHLIRKITRNAKR